MPFVKSPSTISETFKIEEQELGTGVCMCDKILLYKLFGGYILFGISCTSAPFDYHLHTLESSTNNFQSSFFCMYNPCEKLEVKVAQSCLTLCNPIQSM